MFVEIEDYIPDDCDSVSADFVKGYEYAGGILEAEYCYKEEGFFSSTFHYWVKIKGEWLKIYV